MAKTVNVKIEEGEIQGIVCENVNGTEYYSFSGVPYAEPPVGKLRFQEPIPVQKWDGVKDATKDDNAFIEGDLLLNTVEKVSENLAVNIYTPHLPKNKKETMPVMVFFHGGGFMYGSPKKSEFGPDYLIEKDVVMVSVGYRLGVFGFLCLDIPEAPGNAGLKDQVLALKWVQRNIEAFNGNPSNVTIFGTSAGGASVEYHIISPLSRNLFHKAISHSGSILNPWAFHLHPRRYAFELAKTFGKDFTNRNDLLDFLIEVPAKELAKAMYVLGLELKKNPKGGHNLPFGPAIEKEFDNCTSFLNDHPINILKSGNHQIVPYLTGFALKEGLLMKQMLSEKFTVTLNNESFCSNLPVYFSENEGIARDIDLFYKKNVKSDYLKEEAAIEFFGDVDFTSGIIISAKLQSSNNPSIYLYKFSYDGAFNSLKKLFSIPEKGATHADQEGYIATTITPFEEGNETDKKVRMQMVQMWTDFAKFGNPTPTQTTLIDTTWLPILETNVRLLNIDAELKLEEKSLDEFINLWEKYYARQFEISNLKED